MKRVLLKPGGWFISRTGHSTPGAFDLTKEMSQLGFSSTFTTSDWVAGTGVSTLVFDSSNQCLSCVADSAMVQVRDTDGKVVIVDETIIKDGVVTLQVVTGDEFDGIIVIK